MSSYVGYESIDRELSLISLGILEDSGWYIINYDYADIP